MSTQRKILKINFKSQEVQKNKPPPRHNHLVLDTLLKLKEKYPVLKKRQPLETGTHKIIYGEFPDISHRLIRRALSCYTRETPYLKSVISETHRVTLEGTQASIITQAQKDYALKILRQRE